MKLTQKMIKYFAIALAIVIIVNIFYFILTIVNGFTYFTEDNTTSRLKEIKISSDYASLKIDLKASSLKIVEGDSFKLETNNKNLVASSNKDLLIIKEAKKITKNSKVILTIPTDTSFKEVSIDNGAGEIIIDNLNSQKIDFDLGAGKFSIKNIEVLEKAQIDTGAGLTNINNASINNLDLEIGAGEVNYNGIITGSSNIDAGVGSLNINLNNKLNDYNLIISKGLGEIKLNSKSVKSGSFGKGSSLINIDGGIGTINIQTK